MAKAGATKRRVLRAALLGLVVLIGYFALKVAWFATGKPTISTDYAAEYNERVRPVNFDPNGNAALDYRDALTRLPAMPENVRRLGSLQDYEPSGTERKIMESWIASSDEALRLIHQAARRPGFWVELSTVNILDPVALEELDFAKFREAALCLRYRAQDLAARGDAAGALDCILTVCRMARHMEGRGRMQINLGQALHGLAMATAFDLLAQADMDPVSLRDAQTQFEEILSTKAQPSFQSDEVLLLDAIQRFFTDNGKADGHLIPGILYHYTVQLQSSKPKNELAADIAYLRHLSIAWSHPTRQQTVRTLETLIRSAGELIEQPPWELHAKGTTHADQLRGIVEGNYFLRSVMADKSLAWTIDAYHGIRATGEALIATMGVLRFQRDKGVRPRSLEELASAGYVRQVPIDPYSGKPLVYRQTDDSFTLYSCGRDFDDDNGTQSTWGDPLRGGGDQVFWPVEERRK